MPELPGELRSVLKQVSRSFFLTLSVLPSSLRLPVGLAYLLARTADTIADTRLVSRADRLAHLDRLLREIDGSAPSRAGVIGDAIADRQPVTAERELLRCLPRSLVVLEALPLHDRAHIRALLQTLIHGMQRELRIFPGEDEGRVVALESSQELDRHTYFAAGCVGEFWTQIAVDHRPALRAWDIQLMTRRGVRFGQGLQMTNVLRDLAQDLRIGRCYLPREALATLGLAPPDLLRPGAIDSLRPLLWDLLVETLELYAEGWAYLIAIPPREVRMRLACAWPLLIGLRTLERIAVAGDLLEPQIRVKIPRSAVYGILARSSILVLSSRGLELYYRKHRDRVRMLAAVDR